MKFEDCLMQQGDDNRKRLDLEEEVEKLQAELHEEEEINKVLHIALHGPISSHPCLTSMLPPQVQALIAELAMVEEEIIWLERKVDELKLSLYQERKQMKEWKTQQQQQQQRKLRRQNHLPPCVPSPGNRSVLNTESQQLSRSQHYGDSTKEKTKYRKASAGSATEILSMASSGGKPRRQRGKTHDEPLASKEVSDGKPNELSEELIKCLIGIFLDLNQAPKDAEGTFIAPKLSLSSKNSKSSKTTFNCKASMFPFNHNVSNLDPYGIMPELDGTIRDIGPYKNFIQITRSSIDIHQFSERSSSTTKLRVLMHRLGSIDLTFLTYKEKLAFWINIYNACIMNAFLEHGLPSSHDQLLDIMNKAEVNVGGIVLNALAIEHFILRHPCEGKIGPADEKEMLLQHVYGLGYPEPNVTFALCRGSWSSPALRVYTPDEVVNELGRAKVEYLEASVGVTGKKKIVVPKLLQWHMTDFADDMESLLEWVYSQLPQYGSLKKLMMQCLNGDAKSPTTKMVEIQPYKSEFRYLLLL